MHFVVARLNGHSRSFEVIYFGVSEKRNNNFGLVSERSEHTVTESSENRALKSVHSETVSEVAE